MLQVLAISFPQSSNGIAIDTETEALPAAPLFSRNWSKKQFAANMQSSMSQYEIAVSDVKKQLFGAIGPGSRVLELGIGTAPNLKHYPPSCEIVGVDPNPYMQLYAQQKAARPGAPTLKWVTGEGEHLRRYFEQGSFDAAVVTLTLCSVADPDKVLFAIRSVLRPGGKLIFVEHVAAQNNSLLRYLQAALDPLQQLVSDGCHLTRDTEAILKSAEGFQLERLERFRVSGLEAALISPHISGVAIAV
mmetsp:Transcript_22666/g.55343  ORF Transcript_22666/g.55343 Transcript_22666/m.55343 type:complete len:246 (+) Transcript_22666:138-875(+)